ncbi:MAG: TonB-dependent receptor, partial [Chitinophagales bacterium]|nr:TonB-dependent receptor [Chitinophagales bacterium]
EKIEGLTIGTAWNFAYEEGGQFFMWSGLDRDALLPSDPKSAFNKDVRTDYIQRRISLSPFINYFDKKDNKHSFNFRYYNNFSTNFSLESNFTNHIYGEYTYSKSLTAKGIELISGVSGYYTTTKGLNVGNLELDASNASIFIQADKKFFGKLNFTGGIRVEYNKVDSIIPDNKLTILSIFKKNGDFTSPVKPLLRFGMNYQAHQATFIRASWGQGFRVPTLNEYFVDLKRTIQVQANPNLLPENGWSAEIGVKQGVKVGSWQGFFDYAFFFTKYVDLIDFSLTPTFTIQAQNLDDARIWGHELSALGQGKLFGYPFTFLAGYTFIQPILLNPSEARKKDYPDTYQYINYRSKHNFKADVETTIKKLSLGISSTFTSVMINLPFTTNNVPGVVEYREKNNHGEWVCDTRIRWNFTDKTKLGFVVKNVFNNEYTTRPGILEAPRNYTLQFQHEF